MSGKEARVSASKQENPNPMKRNVGEDKDKAIANPNPTKILIRDGESTENQTVASDNQKIPLTKSNSNPIKPSKPKKGTNDSVGGQNIATSESLPKLDEQNIYNIRSSSMTSNTTILPATAVSPTPPGKPLIHKTSQVETNPSIGTDLCIHIF